VIRDLRPRQLPTFALHAVPTRECQFDPPSLLQAIRCSRQSIYQATPAAVAKTATRDETEEVRGLARAVLALGGAKELLEGLHGRHAFGSGLFGELPRDDPDGQAATVCFLLALGRLHGLAAAAADFDDAVKVVAEWPEQLQFLRDLSAQVPAFAPLVDPRRIGRALRVPGGEERLREEIEAVRREHADEVRRFLEDARISAPTAASFATRHWPSTASSP
jgi:hypothetical protein